MSEMNTRESLSKNEKNIDSTYFRRLVMKKVLLVVVVIMFAASMALAQASAGSDFAPSPARYSCQRRRSGCRSCHILTVLNPLYGEWHNVPEPLDCLRHRCR